MSQTRKIKRALVSVFHKDGLDEILRTLHAQGVELLSTGGTQSFIESLGIPCVKVEDVTTYPSILGGRVKTLHPKRRPRPNCCKKIVKLSVGRRNKTVSTSGISTPSLKISTTQR